MAGPGFPGLAHWTCDWSAMRTRRPLQVILLLAILAACGSSSLQRHALAATVLHDAAVGARAAVLQSLADEVADVTEGVTDPAQRMSLALEVRARYLAPGGPVDRANAFSAAGHAYVQALLVVEQKKRPTWAELGPPLRAALAAYASLRSVLGDRLPAVPAVVDGLVTP